MRVQPTAMILLLAMSFVGCSSNFSRTNTATIVIDGLPHQRSQEYLLIDPSLEPEVNESHGAGFFWDSKQKVVITSDRPLKLVPDTNEPPIDKVSTIHTATIVVNGLGTPEPICPILVDPSLKAEVNDSRPEFGGFNVRQKIKVASRVPLWLVPATPQDVERLRTNDQRQTPTGRE